MDSNSKNLLLTNTLSNKKELFVAVDAKHVKMYVCGVTPYDYSHIGHGRCYVTFDVLYRVLRFLGYQVTYCRNFTDIDDKLLARARQEFGDPSRYKDVADRYISSFEEDMERLGCVRPTVEPRVTQHIGAIIQFIEALVASGHAYACQGDVYFSIDTFASYGKLSKRNKDDLIAGARVAVNEKKRNPLDFALWKHDEVVSWPSPWGPGRPGWHIECSSLIGQYLGDQIDIHGGGMDLIFPHHENEIAQSESLTKKDLARYWVHNAFVRVNQEKMSKSLNNFLTLKDLCSRVDPMVARYLFLQHQYRNPLDFAVDELDSITKGYQRLCKLVDADVPSGYLPDVQELLPVAQRMMHFLCDDLNVPGMLGVVFENAKNIQADPELKKQVAFILKELTGLTLQPLPEQTVELTPEIQKLVAQREEARKLKDWATADALREQLSALGFDVQDKKV